MTFRTSVLAATAFLLTGSASAIAADLYGQGMKDVGYAPAPVYSPMGFYLRGDASWSGNDIGEVYDPRLNTLFRAGIDNTWGGGFGVGYYFSRNVRTDVTFDWRGTADVTGTTVGGAVMNTGVKSMVTLFNVYYDFDIRSHFTPYIGVGLGFSRNETSSGGFSSCACTVEFAGAKEWNAAGALMAGVSAKLRDRLSLDAGYRYLYMGDAKTGEFATTVGGTPGSVKINDLNAHEFRIGVRWDIK